MHCKLMSKPCRCPFAFLFTASPQMIIIQARVWSLHVAPTLFPIRHHHPVYALRVHDASVCGVLYLLFLIPFCGRQRRKSDRRRKTRSVLNVWTCWSSIWLIPTGCHGTGPRRRASLGRDSAIICGHRLDIPRIFSGKGTMFWLVYNKSQ